MSRRISVLPACALALTLLGSSRASACEGASCSSDDPDVTFGPGTLTASFVSIADGSGVRMASNSALAERTYSLIRPCDFTDPRQGGCLPGDGTCPEIPDRLISIYFVLSQRVVQVD